MGILTALVDEAGGPPRRVARVIVVNHKTWAANKDRIARTCRLGDGTAWDPRLIIYLSDAGAGAVAAVCDDDDKPPRSVEKGAVLFISARRLAVGDALPLEPEPDADGEPDSLSVATSVVADRDVMVTMPEPGDGPSQGGGFRRDPIDATVADHTPDDEAVAGDEVMDALLAMGEQAVVAGVGTTEPTDLVTLLPPPPSPTTTTTTSAEPAPAAFAPVAADQALINDGTSESTDLTASLPPSPPPPTTTTTAAAAAPAAVDDWTAPPPAPAPVSAVQLPQRDANASSNHFEDDSSPTPRALARRLLPPSSDDSVLDILNESLSDAEAVPPQDNTPAQMALAHSPAPSRSLSTVSPRSPTLSPSGSPSISPVSARVAVAGAASDSSPLSPRNRLTSISSGTVSLPCRPWLLLRISY